MGDNQKVKIIHGEHNGKVGVVTGVFWGANTVLVKTDNGVKPINIITLTD